jgi:alanyl-tRNA synthetase
MESQAGEGMGALSAGLERIEARLEATATLFERAMALLEERESEVRRIVAAVDTNQDVSSESGLESKLAAAEQQIAELKAQIAVQTEARSAAESKAASSSPRRTLPAATTQFLAKQGIATVDSLEAGALDAALDGLSLEQRIAVKAQLLRAGVLA